jgi:predicted anti-sigma-YlaC factor YlaD
MRGLRSPICDQIRSQVSLELDTGLARLESVRMARHLDRCADCRAFREDVVAFTDALRSAPLERPRRPVILPRSRQARLTAVGGVALRVSAAAAAAIVAVGLAFGERGMTSVEAPTSIRADYLNSPDYEHRIIEQLNDYRVVASRSSIRAI